MNLSVMQVLSESEIKEIHESTLSILEQCGVKILDAQVLDYFKQAGLPVDTGHQTVFFPRACVEDTLAQTPAEFEVFDRDGRPAFVLGDGTPRVAAGHNAVFWVDSETGATRPSTVADVRQFSRICEQLPDIDVLGVPVMPQDVADPRHSLLYAVRACMENSKKPILFSADSVAVNHAIIDMVESVFPGALARQAYGIGQLSPTSPLFWEAQAAESLIETVERQVPLSILPEPNAGITAPYTLAGLLTMNNAECLSGFVLAQLVRRGAKVIYANSWTTTDMRAGYALVGSVETTLCRIAGAQLAKFYGVPCHTTAPNSDNHAHDEQNAWEKTLSLFCSMAAGNDLIVNCGMFATGMTCSHEQLIMDDEISGMSRRLARGIEVNTDTIAKSLIKGIGPRGQGYLTADHTMEWLRSREYYVPRLAVRGPRAIWEAQGAPDTYAVARKEAARLGKDFSAALDEPRRRKLNAILQNG